MEVSVDNEIILITTGKLNPGGRIKVRFDNVDLEDVDLTILSREGFRVGTRTRTDVDPWMTIPPVDFSDEDFVNIEATTEPAVSWAGLIRTVAGSGTMAVEPATIEQSSRNRNIKLTFTATTDFENLVLKLKRRL